MRLLTSKISLTVLVLAAVVGGAFAQDDDWQYQPGILLVSGDGGHVFKDAPGRILSVNGWRRVSRAKLEDVSIYHALIFHPKVRFIGSGGGFSNKGPVSSETITWNVQLNPPDDYQHGEKHGLEIQYNSLTDDITVAGNTYNLSNGNLFIIRLDDKWAPIVSQLQATFNKRAEPERVLTFFKSVLRNDETIQSLELY